MLTVRSFNADWSSPELIWIPGEKFSSYALNVTHLVLPPGELWFCRIFNLTLPHIKDEALRTQVKGFIGQEGAHARGHRDALAVYEANGWDFSESKARLNGIFGRLLGEKVFGRFEVTGKQALRWLRFRLSIVAAVEHVTCVLGTWMINNTELEALGANQQMVDLLKWHGAEEVEHRTVAHDVYVAIGGSNVLRILMTVPVMFLILLTWKRGTQVFISQDKSGPQRYGFKAYRRAAKLGYLPGLGLLFKAFLRYFRWNYHPHSEGSPELAAHTLRELEPERV
ncbi:metal-dependent hydrolase [Ketobacter sp. MCCC 1A13808]|uniref:metal-dependent hydrolase n=1 Tax=Ketobacter sp. MCCC 1A13808 TaxID=2602738 RepID=UPI000F147D0D|nr:metal-dependent hydrolase [Ketobacter sp. MCCC 1A13808]MVF11701.1 metal-dependent hydrolase [Ketobacter sp. MCCC 1A13808]RLP55313.1 MAG: metal-dependent hydrolase [Ketobacter sp.]